MLNFMNSSELDFSFLNLKDFEELDFSFLNLIVIEN